MIFEVLLTGFVLANGAVVEKRGLLTTLDPGLLHNFTKAFKYALLHKATIEMNATADMSKQLEIKMENCKQKLEAKTKECDYCTKALCQVSPSFNVTHFNTTNSYSYHKGPLNDMSRKLGAAVDLLGDNAAGFVNSLKDLGNYATVIDAFSTAVNTITDELDKVGHSFVDAGNTATDTVERIGDGLTDIGNGLTDGLKNAGHAIGHIGGSIGHAVGGLLGKKREIDANKRQCMEKCTSCRPLLLPNQAELVRAVCGGDIASMNATITYRMIKIQKVFDSVIDKAYPIITKIQFDPASMNSKLQLSNVYVTVRLNRYDISYKTAVPFSLAELPEAASNMAMEYWGKVKV